MLLKTFVRDDYKIGMNAENIFTSCNTEPLSDMFKRKAASFIK